MPVAGKNLLFHLSHLSRFLSVFINSYIHPPEMADPDFYAYLYANKGRGGADALFAVTM